MKYKKTKISGLVSIFLFLVSIIPCAPGDGNQVDIHQLARKGDSKKIKALLEKNPELVNSKDKCDWTPLQIAAFYGHLKLVKLLIRKGARINESDKFGFTALHLAALKKNHNIFEWLLENGAVIKAEETDAYISSGMFSASDVPGELWELLFPAESTRSTTQPKPREHKTPASVSAVMTLKKEMIDVSLNPESLRKLREAAEVLITGYADQEAAFGLGNTPLHTAAQNGEPESIKKFLEINPEWVHAKNRFGITPLHYAAVGDHRQTAIQLINAGADINAKTGTGITPLYGAVSENKKDMVQLLISRGAKVNEPTRDGAVPLHAVTQKDIAELLTAAGAHIKIKNNYGFTPLHIAAHYGHLEVIEYLLSRGAQLESRTDIGWTPLCEAIYGRQKQAVELLLARGADANAVTKTGHTPLKIAISLNCIDIIPILKKYGAH
jgi:ankyrin repeat protein